MGTTGLSTNFESAGSISSTNRGRLWTECGSIWGQRVVAEPWTAQDGGSDTVIVTLAPGGIVAGGVATSAIERCQAT